MLNSELLSKLADSITDRTQGLTGDVDAITLRLIRQDIGVIFVDAFQTAPCEHPPRDRYNHLCFICGRTVNGEKTKDATAKDSAHK